MDGLEERKKGGEAKGDLLGIVVDASSLSGFGGLRYGLTIRVSPEAAKRVLALFLFWRFECVSHSLLPPCP